MADRGTEKARAALKAAQAVDDPPFDPSAVTGDTPARAARRGKGGRKGKGRQSATEGGEAPPDDPAEADLAIARELAPLDQNDRDNGRRFVRWHGPDVVYASGLGWMIYSGTHWLRDEGELRVRLYAQDLVDRIKLEAEVMVPVPRARVLIETAERLAKKPESDLTDAELDAIEAGEKAAYNLAQRRAGRIKFAISTGNAGRTDALLRQAASRRSAAPEAFDADRLKFNVLNGTLEFFREPDPERPEGSERQVGSARLLAHQRADLITKCADVAFDREARCPHFDDFLARVQPDPAMRLFLQVAHGYALLTGGNDEQRLLYHYGTGANGKSAFLEALGRLAASYRAVVDPATITGEAQREGNKANSDIARLFSARLVTIEELPRGVPLKENLIKALTGGTRMVARFLQKEFFEFEPEFTAVLSGNDLPTVSGTDYGIWRRLLIVPWEVTIPEGERIAPGTLAARFDAERAGILNWLIEGFCLYLANGLAPYTPRKVTEFTDEYREERDPVGTFAAACLLASPGSRVTAGDLHKAYADWCEANGLKPWNQTSVGNRLKTLGYKKARGRLVEYLDIRLGDVPTKYDPRSKTPEPPADPPGDPGWQPKDGGL